MLIRSTIPTIAIAANVPGKDALNPPIFLQCSSIECSKGFEQEIEIKLITSTPIPGEIITTSYVVACLPDWEKALRFSVVNYSVTHRQGSLSQYLMTLRRDSGDDYTVPAFDFEGEYDPAMASVERFRDGLWLT